MSQHQRLSLASLAGRTGRGVRVAIVDSGIHAGHPHVGGVAGGVAIDDRGHASDDLTDRIGHGTAVAAAIHEKAAGADLLVIKVFDRALAATADALAAAIRWAAERNAALINLSLGTTNAAHRAALSDAVAEAIRAGSTVVAAAPQENAIWLPGALDGVVAVEVDWECPRDSCDVFVNEQGKTWVRASGYPRPIPGVPPERNLKGQSFAVANATALLALSREQRAG